MQRVESGMGEWALKAVEAKVDAMSERGCGELPFLIRPSCKNRFQRPHIRHTLKSIEDLHLANRFTLLAVWKHFSSLSYQRLLIVLSLRYG